MNTQVCELIEENWLDRWKTGRTGWHEPCGNSGLKAHWPDLIKGSSVLVPLCGKSPDLIWLASLGLEVSGVELSAIAVRSLFAENDLSYTVKTDGALDCYSATDMPLSVCCGDYFNFDHSEFDALYDRGALVALPEDSRPGYVAHTQRLLKSASTRLIVTLEYDQRIVQGPPFSVMSDELSAYWTDLQRVEERDDIDNCPPKFRAAGLTDIKEVFWRSPC